MEEKIAKLKTTRNTPDSSWPDIASRNPKTALNIPASRNKVVVTAIKAI